MVGLDRHAAHLRADRLDEDSGVDEVGDSGLPADQELADGASAAIGNWAPSWFWTTTHLALAKMTW